MKVSHLITKESTKKREYHKKVLISRRDSVYRIVEVSLFDDKIWELIGFSISQISIRVILRTSPKDLAGKKVNFKYQEDYSSSSKRSKSMLLTIELKSRL